MPGLTFAGTLPMLSSHTPKVNEGESVAKPPKRRVPRQPTRGKIKDDRAAALVVLASVGATPDDARVKSLGQTFQQAEEHKAMDALCDEVDRQRNPWLDVHRIKSALDRVKLVTEEGEALRATLFRVFPLRFLSAEPLSEREEAVARRWGLDVKGRRVSEREEAWARRFGMKVPGRRVVLPIADPSKKAKRGRRVDAAIESTILEAAVVDDWSEGICALDGDHRVQIGNFPDGWDWEVCAAAVFVTKADKRRYGAIRKSFRSWSNRHSRGK